MLEFIYNALSFFEDVFPRHKTWRIFCMIVIGFLGSTEITGITSFCRFWGLGESAYKAFEHFLRFSNWQVCLLVSEWAAFVVSQNVAVKIKGRTVLAGDHTYVPKDGRQIPGVVTLHQNSETQSKPSFFRGQCVGAICMIAGTLGKPFGLPLNFGIHQGTIHIGEDTDEGKETLGTRITQMALDFAIKNDAPCLLTLDAYFPCRAVINLASSVCNNLEQPLVTLIIKAKKSYVAFYEAEKPKERKPGPDLKYGERVKLMDFFNKPEEFEKAPCEVYGKVEDVSYMVINLLWKPTGGLIRFVLTDNSHGRMILMCTDLTMDPLLAIQAYCLRMRIETMFDVLKNLMGAFNCHFWSKQMPRRSRKPKKNEDLIKPSKEAVPAIIKCWEGYVKYIMLGAIATGLSQLISLKLTNEGLG